MFSVGDRVVCLESIVNFRGLSSSTTRRMVGTTGTVISVRQPDIIRVNFDDPSVGGPWFVYAELLELEDDHSSFEVEYDLSNLLGG